MAVGSRQWAVGRTAASRKSALGKVQPRWEALRGLPSLALRAACPPKRLRAVRGVRRGLSDVKPRGRAAVSETLLQPSNGCGVLRGYWQTLARDGGCRISPGSDTQGCFAATDLPRRGAR